MSHDTPHSCSASSCAHQVKKTKIQKYFRIVDGGGSHNDMERHQLTVNFLELVMSRSFGCLQWKRMRNQMKFIYIGRYTIYHKHIIHNRTQMLFRNIDDLSKGLLKGPFSSAIGLMDLKEGSAC